MFDISNSDENAKPLLAFLQCDVFIYVSCAQTALLDSKEFLAPIITPFEAMLAFNRYDLKCMHGCDIAFTVAKVVQDALLEMLFLLYMYIV